MVAHALVIDQFGNVGLNVDHDRSPYRHHARRTGGRGRPRRELRGHPRPDVRRREPGELIVTRTRTARSRSHHSATRPHARSQAGRRGATTDAISARRRPPPRHRLHERTAKELAAAVAHTHARNADEHTAGEGAGRVWTAPPRSAVLMSVVLWELESCCRSRRPSPWRKRFTPTHDQVAQRRLIDGRKLAGILVEGRPQEGGRAGMGNVGTELFRTTSPTRQPLSAWRPDR